MSSCSIEGEHTELANPSMATRSWKSAPTRASSNASTGSALAAVHSPTARSQSSSVNTKLPDSAFESVTSQNRDHALMAQNLDS